MPSPAIQAAFRPMGSLDRAAAEDRLLSRRAALALGAGGVVAAALALVPGASAAVPSHKPPGFVNPCHYRIPWKLEPFRRTDVDGCDPDEVGSDPTPCAACAACHGHAANKLFVSAAAANAERAHAGCRCTVVQARPMLTSTWNKLFRRGGKRLSVDRRWMWVENVLRNDPNYA